MQIVCFIHRNVDTIYFFLFLLHWKTDFVNRKIDILARKSRNDDGITKDNQQFVANCMAWSTFLPPTRCNAFLALCSVLCSTRSQPWLMKCWLLGNEFVRTAIRHRMMNYQQRCSYLCASCWNATVDIDKFDLKQNEYMSILINIHFMRFDAFNHSDNIIYIDTYDESMKKCSFICQTLCGVWQICQSIFWNDFDLKSI